jgi:Zn-dependent membrane protease YugP
MNPLYLLLIIPALLGWYAQSRVRRVYKEYGKRSNSRGHSGLEVARYLLSHRGLNVSRHGHLFADHAAGGAQCQ